MTRAKILLVDDEPAFCQLAARWLTDLNYEVVTAGTLADALQSIETFAADLVLLDLSLPPQFDPQFTLASIKAFGARPVIIITGHAERELALEAVAQGAWDFIAKPIDPHVLAVVVKRAIAKQALTQELAQLKLRVAGGMGAQSYIGSSSSAQQIRSLIERIAPTDVRVLVSGPSGTGKEVISRLLHDLSLRSQQAFVSVHCGAIPAELLESELFGHTKGAFTGADKDKIGLLALADGGTLFLDEIGEMPLAMQVKLLRVLQEGTYFAVGGRVQQSIDVRVVSATNADLPEKVALGEFREDLYYRIKGINIETKSLNERSEDVALLVPYFMQLLQAERQQVYTLAPRVLTWLRQRSWPGNVRELKNVLETPSNRFLARQNILTKGAIVETESGKAKITNRPSQEGSVQGVLIE